MNSGTELNNSVTQSLFMMQHLQNLQDPNTIQLHDMVMVDPYTAQGQVPYQMCSIPDVHSVPGWMPYYSLEVQQPSPIQLQDSVKVEHSDAHMLHHWIPAAAVNMVSGCTPYPTMEYQVKDPCYNHLVTEQQAFSCYCPVPVHAVNQGSVIPSLIQPPPHTFFPQNDHAHVSVQPEIGYTVSEQGYDPCMPSDSLSDLEQGDNFNMFLGDNQFYNPSSQVCEEFADPSLSYFTSLHDAMNIFESESETAETYSTDFFNHVVNYNHPWNYQIFGDTIGSGLDNVVDVMNCNNAINQVGLQRSIHPWYK